MPQRISTVQLDDSEKTAVRAAADGRRVKTVLSELGDRILGITKDDTGPRRGTSPAAPVTGGSDSLSADRVKDARTAMSARRDAIAALPDVPSRDPLLADLDTALGILDEAAKLVSQEAPAAAGQTTPE